MVIKVIVVMVVEGGGNNYGNRVVEVVEESEIETFSLLGEFPWGPLAGAQMHRQLGKCNEERNRKTREEKQIKYRMRCPVGQAVSHGTRGATKDPSSRPRG